MHVLAVLLLAFVSARAVPHFTINLSSPASQRWKEVALHYRWASHAMLDGFESFLDRTLTSDELKKWEDVVIKSMSADQVEELDGYLSFVDDPRISRRTLVIFQGMYELQYSAFCSGILAAMENGTVVHGRNLDYALPFTINGTIYNWHDVTFDATFIRNGTPLITSVTWPGHVGIHTAMRFGGWTYEQNTRNVGNNRSLNLAAGLRGAKIHGLFARSQMEKIEDFGTAVDVLQKANFMAPQYFIMAGSREWEGAVLTISRDGQEEGCSTRFSSKEDWHILQTNDDWCGLPEDLRRPEGNWIILPEKLPDPASVSASAVLDIITHPPLKNLGTVFHWIAIPATGFHETVLAWKPKKPPTNLKAKLPSWRSKWNKAAGRGHIGT